MIILASLYFVLRNGKKEYQTLDTERQALLPKNIPPKQGPENSASTENGYGATTENGAQSEDAENTSETASDDSWIADRRKAEEMIAKRLKQDGNWFTYAKGFAVSTQSPSLLLSCSPTPDLLPLHLACQQ